VQVRLDQLGELGLIRLLSSRAMRQDPGVRVGVGDDAAVVLPCPGADLLLTCDALVEGIHFRRAWYAGHPEKLGRKALAVNLSDVAAMGGWPRYCLVTLLAEPAMPLDFVLGVYDGLEGLARESGTTLVGGDTVRLESGFILDVFLVGEVESGAALLRSGARPGDLIAVTGDFGLARAGLEVLERGELEPSGKARPAAGAGDRALAVARQLEPPVRLGEARALAALGCLHALSDTSDGLSRQVRLIGEASQVGAVVEAGAVPVHPATARLAALHGLDPLDWALAGGEEYELIAALAPADLDQAQAAVAALGRTRLKPVGQFTAAPGFGLRGDGGRLTQLPDEGFEHFRGGVERVSGG
jgi:thiamine-monophosphate kinase